jgi:hypothetical protein
MNEESLERELDKEMANEVPKKETVYVERLSIDEDTSFDIYYDIYNDGNTDYLYIKMTENTAVAPFYYNRSFTIEELQELDDIFRTCDLNEIKDHIKSLFEEKKIKLIYDNENKTIIKMELSVVLFVTKYKIYFKLYKEMIPEEIKDRELLNLYEIEKNNIKMIKELASIFNSFSNQEEKDIGGKLKELIFQFEIPGIEDGELNFGGKSGKNIVKMENQNFDKKEINMKEKKTEDEKIISVKKKEEIEYDTMPLQSKGLDSENSDLFISKISGNTTTQNKINYEIFTNAKKQGKRYRLNEENNTIVLSLKNNTDEDWPMNDIRLVCNEQTSTIKCTVEDLMYDIEKEQDGEFILKFDPKDLIPGKKYQCNLELFLKGEKIKDGYAELLISVPKKKDK